MGIRLARRLSGFLLAVVLVPGVTACGDGVVDAPVDVSGIGDSSRGHDTATVFGGVIDTPCTRCHTFDANDPLRVRLGADGASGPRLKTVASIAGDRVPGLTAEEYLQQSILDPEAYILGGDWSNMPTGYRYLLNDEDVGDVVAFLLAQ